MALACALAALPVFASAARQDIDLLKLERTRRIAISRLAGPVTLDGLSDEAAWRGATRFPFIQQGPQFGAPPSERTEALAGYDDDYLYFAGRLYDREPDKIQAPTKKRDAMVANTEWFGVLLDTFNDKENGLIFFTDALGPAAGHDGLQRLRVPVVRHERHAGEHELEHVLGQRGRPHRRGMVRRDPHPPEQPPLPGEGRPGRDGPDPHALAHAEKRDRTSSRPFPPTGAT